MNDKFLLEEIDISLVVKKVWEKKYIFLLVLLCTFIIACIYALSLPRTYITKTEMAPEIGRTNNNYGSLGSLAETLGFNINDVKTTDAINPLLYPKLMDDNNFLSEVLSVSVTDKDGHKYKSYYDYLENYQKSPWWKFSIRDLFIKETEEKEASSTNPYLLTKNENNVYELARNNLSISIDKLSGVITISTKAQDPYICMEMANALRTRLQDFITGYRTSKAKVDLTYYTKLTKEAKLRYEKARQLYGSFSDSNVDIVLESYRAKQNDLENDMQLKYNTYTTFLSQEQAALAKVQERTPAFTILRGASLPIKPAAPKRMFIVLGWMAIATFCFVAYAFYAVYRETQKE